MWLHGLGDLELLVELHVLQALLEDEPESLQAITSSGDHYLPEPPRDLNANIAPIVLAFEPMIVLGQDRAGKQRIDIFLVSCLLEDLVLQLAPCPSALATAPRRSGTSDRRAQWVRVR